MKKILHILWIIILVLVFNNPGFAVAESGLPNSAEFGYGMRLDLSGTQINPSIAAAASMKLNWLAIDFDWAKIWPAREASPELDPLIEAMALAQQNNLSVMVSIVKPPEWVITPEGPDPTITDQVVKYLARTFPDVLLAIELFPGANTIQGWGTTPDPDAYLGLLKSATQTLNSIGSPVVMVAAGLTPLPPKSQAGNMDDLVYLEQLYKAGGQAWMPIISIQLPDTTGDPLLTPTTDERRCLRHFEEVRQVMLAYDHKQGLIWLTDFSWPSGNLHTSDNLYKSSTEQTRWVNQAYQILKAQLFLGVAFFTQINPPGTEGSTRDRVSLIRQDLSLHPAFINLGLLISPPADNSNMKVQTVLVKRIVQAIQFKPSVRNANVGQ
jgi:hypothetical protein